MGLIIIAMAIGAAIQGGGLTLLCGYLAYKMLRQVTSQISDAEVRLCVWIGSCIAIGVLYLLALRSLPFDSVFRSTGGSPERFFEGIMEIAFTVPAAIGLASLLVAAVVWVPFRIICKLQT